MPNIKSAKKRVKVAQTKAAQNKALKSALKTSMKKYENAVASGNMELAETTYSQKCSTARRRNRVIKNRKHSSHRMLFLFHGNPIILISPFLLLSLRKSLYMRETGKVCTAHFFVFSRVDIKDK